MLQVKIGDTIRGYDFKPMVGREDSFVEGKVVERNAVTECGYNAYKILCTRDVFGGDQLPAGMHSRVGQTVFVPWKTSFQDYPGRVINLSS